MLKLTDSPLELLKQACKGVLLKIFLEIFLNFKVSHIYRIAFFAIIASAVCLAGF